MPSGTAVGGAVVAAVVVGGVVVYLATREDTSTTPVPPPPPPAPSVGTTATVTAGPTPQRLDVRIVEKRTDLPTGPPAAGHFRVHLIDVGTGLAVLVQGSDFNLLFDGGSGDDKRSGVNNRLLAYLWAALGPSGSGASCVPKGEGYTSAPGAERRIDHVVLSHPHEDHGSLLRDVLACYDVDHVWDSGAVNDAVFYRDFLVAVSKENGVVYRTARVPPANRKVKVKNKTITLPSWAQFAEGPPAIPLGADASMTVLHADGEAHADPNENSIVLRVDLGKTSVLLTGDAESGPRLPPKKAGGASNPLGDIEEHLVTHHAAAIDVDVLQVGHHGSETSSRWKFLQAVSPVVAFVGAGGKKYQTVVLPDASVVSALAEVAAVVVRTDARDKHRGGNCRALTERFGTDGDAYDGGCDSYLLEIDGARPACCQLCAAGKPCGNGCVPATATCTKAPGCACATGG